MVNWLAVAVSPFLVTYANLARGFMLADLALLCAMWALLSWRDSAAFPSPEKAFVRVSPVG